MEPVHKETNAELGVEARVFAYNGQFTVTLMDTDAGETMPCMKGYASLDAAIATAKEWANTK
jgi:hypothetical protein